MPQDEERRKHELVYDFVEASVAGFMRDWAKKRKVDPFVITWPSGAVQTHEGETISGPCLLKLEGVEPKVWTEKIAQAVGLTNAYAVMLAEQKSDAVVLIVETERGARCWTLPIIRSGDVCRLGRAKITNNLERLGVLWSQKKNQA